MGSLALLIPIHPNHYHYIYTLINTINQNIINNIDLFLIFSNNDDYNLFNKKDKITKIIIPSILPPNIVTYKKFFALNQLKENNKYDYFIVCDAEINIIPENFNKPNILNKIESIFKNKTIYAGNCGNTSNITNTSANLFSNENINKLKHITNNFTLYYWWSDLPVYKREHLNDFFNKIGCYDRVEWGHFDHLIYLNYLILYHNFNILNITHLINRNWSLESYTTNDIEKLKILKKNNYSFSWITPKLWKQHQLFLMNEGSFLLYHLDR